MTNTQRNTTVISIILVIVLGTGYYFTSRLKKQDDLIKGKNKELKAEIVKLDEMLAKREQIEREYEELMFMISQQSKLIAQTDNPAITYNYLLTLLKWMKQNINFDFSLASKKGAETNWNEYIISGKAAFIDATNLIKSIEYQRPVLSIEDVSFAEYTSDISDTVQFSVVFKTHFTPEGTAMGTVEEKQIDLYRSNFASFRPRIYEKLFDDEVDPELVRIDKVQIFGITESKVFLRDERGILHILSVGDKVAYGYLYSIDPKLEKIVFRINQYGSTEDNNLFMSKTK
jgi:hypothetical protein